MSLLELPIDVLLHILKQLNLTELGKLMLTCKSLRDIILDNKFLWKYICSRRFIIHDAISPDAFRLNKGHFPYIHQCRISQNWKSGIFKNEIILRHNTNYMPWLTFNSNCLIVSVGEELRCYPTDKRRMPVCEDLLWAFQTPKVLRKGVRTNDISRFLVKNGFIVCGNRNGCVAVYDWISRRKPKLLYHIRDCHLGGKMEASAVEYIVRNNKVSTIFSVSNDTNNVRLTTRKSSDDVTEICTNGLTYKARKNLIRKQTNRLFTARDVWFRGGMGAKCMAMNAAESQVAIGLNGNSKPLFLDVETSNIVVDPNDSQVERAVRDIQWHDEHTAVHVSRYGNVSGTDVRTSDVVFNTYDPFHSCLYCVKTDGDRAIVVGSSEYTRCVLYDVRKLKKHVQIYFTQKKASPVYSLDFNNANLIAAADRSIAAVNFNINVSGITPRDYSENFEFFR